MLVCHAPHHTRHQATLRRMGMALGSLAERQALQHAMPHCASEARCHDQVNSLLRGLSCPPRLAASTYPGTVSSSGLPPAPAPAIGEPQCLPRSPPRPYTPPGSAGHGQDPAALAHYRPARPCPYPPAGCRSGCGPPDDAGGSRGWSRCCGPSASASAWPQLPSGASRSAPCWTRLHVWRLPAPPFRFRRQPPS